jgi:lipopolysaccharide biosynthesis protein
MKIRPIAIHLPQFHPIKENDEWWGKGFTEWKNVANGRPRFKNHYQPHLPADLGFYDLRLTEVREAQAEMARQYGIYGFCYYHYWFNGKLLLERPLEDLLREKKPDFPFMLCWANESWSRNWDGQSKQLLLEQKYSFEDDRNHIKYLLEFFKDDRYIKIDGRPVFAVYRTELFPDIAKTAEIWKSEVLKAGLSEPYLIRVESFVDGVKPEQINFDASFEFQPNWRVLPKEKNRGFPQRVLRKLGIYTSPFLKERVIDYGEFVTNAMKSPPVDYKRFPGITPMWDNSARRKTDALIFRGSTPEKYEEWLRFIVAEFEPYTPNENFLFINAWNEWAEGNHLEPCQKWGRAYLEATASVLFSETAS